MARSATDVRPAGQRWEGSAYNYLDLVPKGRDEDNLEFTQAWVRYHDRYED